jgi:hypothetical protein
VSVTNLMSSDRRSPGPLCSHITCYCNLIFEINKNNATVTGFLLTVFYFNLRICKDMCITFRVAFLLFWFYMTGTNYISVLQVIVIVNLPVNVCGLTSCSHLSSRFFRLCRQILPHPCYTSVI